MSAERISVESGAYSPPTTTTGGAAVRQESGHMRVIVEITKDQNTRRAQMLTLLYGPYNTETPGTDAEWCRTRSQEKAEEDMRAAGLDGFEVTQVRVLDGD